MIKVSSGGSLHLDIPLPDALTGDDATIKIVVESSGGSIIEKARRGELTPPPNDFARFHGCFKGKSPWEGNSVNTIRQVRDEW